MGGKGEKGGGGDDGIGGGGEGGTIKYFFTNKEESSLSSARGEEKKGVRVSRPSTKGGRTSSPRLGKTGKGGEAAPDLPPERRREGTGKWEMPSSSGRSSPSSSRRERASGGLRSSPADEVLTP